jgi:hypothetical protein
MEAGLTIYFGFMKIRQQRFLNGVFKVLCGNITIAKTIIIDVQESADHS